MTTIAWDGQQLAADRRCTRGTYVFEVPPKIRRTYDGRLIAAAGHIDICALMLEWLSNTPARRGPRPKEQAETDEFCVCLEIVPGGPVIIHERYASYPVHSGAHATGSGRDFALGAMAAGKSARDAVAIASRLDYATGGPIDVLALEPARPVSRSRLSDLWPVAEVSRWRQTG